MELLQNIVVLLLKRQIRQVINFRYTYLRKRSEIEKIVSQYGGVISSEVTSLYNVGFEDITRTDLAKSK